MFINQSFVAIIFKLINFFAIIALACYVYKKYLKADILSSIEKKETDHQDLLIQQTTLENKQKNLDLLLKQEMLQCQDFRSNIDEWKKVVTLEQEKQEQEHTAFIAIIKKRNAEVFLKKEHQRIQNSIIDTVVADLEKSLSHDFKNTKQGTDYLNSILHFMNEKIS
jgi:hypothetical protein